MMSHMNPVRSRPACRVALAAFTWRALFCVAAAAAAPGGEASPHTPIAQTRPLAPAPSLAPYPDAELAAASSPSGLAALPPGTRVLRDTPYGPDPAQRMDVYLPPGHAGRAMPVIFMVHGGAWRYGDKANRPVVENKVARWVPRGFVFISVNYRMLPAANPLVQAQDVARALARAQADAAAWGADPTQFILMGHSAGAHLVALLTASATLARDAGAQPWLGTVVLDSAALDVPRLMGARHLRLYDRAFGDDPAFWEATSPLHQAWGARPPDRMPPVLNVCSSRRAIACPQAQAFAATVQRVGGRAQVLAQDLSHGEINQNLGLPGDYTEAVEAFMATLGDGLRQALGR